MSWWIIALIAWVALSLGAFLLMVRIGTQFQKGKEPDSEN